MQGEFEFYRRLPRRPKRPERLFFSLFPDIATSFRVKEFAERFISERHLSGNQLRAERLHVSLHLVGDYKRLQSKFIFAARRAGDRLSMHPFEMTFPFITSFERPANSRRRSPLVLLGQEDASLVELHNVLGTAMEKNGLSAAQSFTPHMTLFYGSTAVPLQPIEPISFAVGEVVLIHSEKGLSRYNVLGRWSLHN